MELLTHNGYDLLQVLEKTLRKILSIKQFPSKNIKKYINSLTNVFVKN